MQQPLGTTVETPQLTSDAFVTADGEKLPVRATLPDGPIKAVILALHGFNDYSNAFKDPAHDWAKDGIATYAYDQRGFGETPHRGLWPGTKVLASDAASFARQLHQKYPTKPLFLLGESMGGAVALVTVADYPHLPIKGVILAAPAVWTRDDMNDFQTAVLWVGAHTVPWLTLTGQGLHIRASDNTAMLIALGRDPLVIKATRIDTIYGLCNLMDAAMAAASKLSVPALVLYGDHDEIVPRDSILEMLHHLPSDGDPPWRAAFYDTGWHMLLRDLHAEKVIDDVAHWVENENAPLPSGADHAAARVLASN